MRAGPDKGARVRANVGSMIEQEASEEEIEMYLAAEGLTPDDHQPPSGSPNAPSARGLPLPPPGGDGSFLGTANNAAGAFLDGILPGSGRFMAGMDGAAGTTLSALLGDNEGVSAAAFSAEEDSCDPAKEAFTAAP